MGANGRVDLLEQYGRFYGDEHFALAFTAGTTGLDAKRVTTKAWDQTSPLATGDFGAALLKGRGVDHNVAVVLRPSNLIVIECDSEDDLLAVEELDLPVTLTVQSSEPYKRHFYFRPAETLDGLPYVAFRFESLRVTADAGRYFLAPPSIHPSGVQYSFLAGLGPGDTDIVDLPEEIYRGLVERSRREDSEQRERIAVDPDAKISAGQRRETLFRYACMLRRWGRPYEAILAECLEFNNDRCDPPVARELVEVQVKGAMKKQGDQELDVAVDDTIGTSWRPQNLNELPEQPPTPPELGNTHLVYPGKRHVFSGPPESAKTLAAYCILIQVVRTGGKAVLLDFEMGAYDARQRLRELGATALEIDHISYVEPDERATPVRIQQLLELEPDLVVIDAAAGVYSLEGLDDNKRGDVEKISSLYIRAFWRAGIATILIDHVVKDTETRGRYAIGSERKLGGADVHLGFEVIGKQAISRGGKGRYKIATHKDRGGYLKRGHLADLSLSSDPDTHSIEWAFTEPEVSIGDDGYFRPTTLMEKASKELEQRLEPTTRNSVFESIGGTKDYVLKAITALVHEGFVTETSGPNRSKLVESARPYREDNPDDNPEIQPGSSVVRTWFGGGSRTGAESGGSVVRGVTTPEPPRPLLGGTQTTPQIAGWFDENGELDQGRAAHLESIAPDDPDDSELDWK